MDINVQSGNAGKALTAGSLKADHGSMIVDNGPAVEFLKIKNEISGSTISLSNGITLDTNYKNHFLMEDLISGYYFETGGNGICTFGRNTKPIAELRLFKTNEANQIHILIKNSFKQEVMYVISFLELKKHPVTGKEYILIKGRSDHDLPILTQTDSYFLQQLSFSMRKILERYPDGISPVSDESSCGDLDMTVAVLAMIGFGIASSRSIQLEQPVIAVHACLMILFYTLNQPKNGTGEAQPIERSH